ncbi:23S rRNA (adenine2503-C2)-methyltransferase [Alkaliphilus hydrothermalis]|uniref:Probable dual-specificity RNA methyltransferase RlmN n=1 Tax=Alkaliphilus hydrothermalis TaxID=1482730 RepID=A0ABS2NSC2_9FIRM|nr:23S rRNA (adenine(2503)-C(2))-methyltransferase RlmN [Alkaliphilus hydrothermalis]MBM7615847.1 23S rRNA (adenine2503-C2)-methyltransferase [Alkaliphilus hydrothermalis]
MSKTDLLSLTKEELITFMESIGEKKFRAMQIFQWLHKRVKSFEDMSNLSKNLRQKLSDNAYISQVEIAQKLVSKIDGTTKYLFSLQDDHIIEGVVMKYKHGNTACISSQVGCAMGCTFCASTIKGLERNLRAGEMLAQIFAMEEDFGERISNIVLMGSGEPLHNYKEVINFLRVVNDEDGINIGNRHITLSTCGLVPEIRALADLKIPINLAISLHAPNDEIRRQTMPIAKKYSLDELIDSCRYYLQQTNRRITFEYALIRGVNDGEKEAMELSKLLKGLLCHVNLIPVNEVDERFYRKSHQDQIKAFENILKKNGIEVTVRREMGADINAACGQLRNRHLTGLGK